MELTFNEIQSIQAYDSNFTPGGIQPSDKARGQKIRDILIVSHGRGKLHDSGYPFIKVLGRQYKQGVSLDIKYFDLGWHDHCLCNIPVNIDSYGKNIFRIMPHFGCENFVVSPHFISVSTFEVGSMFPGILPNNTLS